ncbi:uncharacterized protein B0I36DRAFT_365293 [Microdochium trichocladiopsis]|uniref:F-box domain-containing protein n=1 Tax=Microdochium trichocladiopsis TaxID=1682393 RepID=A0A9P8Y5Y8_9PEZI|nr:uncharacterized protein B0I36DRAFT_365293 [Microdochium trichocladiopsis]KAH7028191.1 hypothetical protein B0I36DRAFT_365293 [Microdochium trichocladiopsis]
MSPLAKDYRQTLTSLKHTAPIASMALLLQPKAPQPDWPGLFNSGRYYPVLDRLFRHLSMADYITLRRVSRAFVSLDEYVQRQFWNSETWLATFVREVRHFRERIRESDAIIAGPYLLNFFALHKHPQQRSALDIYVATKAQAESLQSVLLYEQYAPVDPESGFNKTTKRFMWRHIDRQNIEICLHVTDRTPLLFVLLNASMTACLNFMTADRAYCMFPRLTFVDSKVLPLRPMGDEVGAALSKAEDILGWGTENYLWPDQNPGMVSRTSGPRRVGDRDTLVVSLEQDSSRKMRHCPLENHQFHITRDRFGGRRPSRTRSQQANLSDLSNYTPQVLAQDIFSPVLRDRCLTGTPLWRSFLTDRLRRWAMVEMYKVGRDNMPPRLRSDIFASTMAPIPDSVVIPEPWRFADEQVQDWYEAWCKDEAAKLAYRDAPR